MLGLVFKHQDFDLKSLIICKQKSGRVTAAGHRAAVDIAGDYVSGGGALLVYCQHGCLTAMGSFTIGSLIPYQIGKWCVPILSIGIIAIGEFETFDDSRLRRNFASVVCGCQCKASVVGHSLRPTAASRCEGRKVVSCGR